MGFYLRKSFRAGPFRLNLSKSGIGASFGVTGARVGLSSRGRAYVHGGRGGVYYRKTFGGGRRRAGGGAGAATDEPGCLAMGCGCLVLIGLVAVVILAIGSLLG